MAASGKYRRGQRRARHQSGPQYGDTGSAIRFGYRAKALCKADRDEGLDRFAKSATSCLPAHWRGRRGGVRNPTCISATKTSVPTFTHRQTHRPDALPATPGHTTGRQWRWTRSWGGSTGKAALLEHFQIHRHRSATRTTSDRQSPHRLHPPKRRAGGFVWRGRMTARMSLSQYRQHVGASRSIK